MSSNYIISREKLKYGGNQDLYLREVERVNQESVLKYQEYISSGKELKGLFPDILTYLCDERRKIAVACGTEKAERFGELRADTVPFSYMNLTPLMHCYAAYGERVFKLMQRELSTFPQNNNNFLTHLKDVKREGYLGRKEDHEIQILNNENGTTRWGEKYFSYQGYVSLCKLCEVKPKSEERFSKDREINDLVERAPLAHLRETNSEEYTKLIHAHASLLYVRPRVPGGIRISDYIVMTRRIEIAGQMYETSRYVTHAYRTLLDDPVALMSRRPIVVVLLHQDSFLIEPMLKEIANIFERAMKWSKQDLKVLQDDVALITYLFSHAMPTTRGSAAISEWIETSLYRYHGYRLAYTDTEKRMVNLEALVSSFEEFRGAYDSLISLTPIDTK